jgi:protein-S-isoprenylcysteine O-methyltransferase Ste14
MPPQSPAAAASVEAFSYTAPVRWGLATSVIAILLFGVSGDLRSPYLWILAAGCSAIALYAIRTISPALARERYHPPTAGVDGPVLRVARFVALATIVFALLDSGRWHLSPPMPAALRLAGLAAFIGGLTLFVYAMSVNRFFSSVVRIQTERGHHVIDSGPYARVRHPGYVGMLLVSAVMPVAFGSWWAFLPGSLMVAFTLRRVWCEDRFLQIHLPGYREYADRVRSRLLPGIW